MRYLMLSAILAGYMLATSPPAGADTLLLDSIDQMRTTSDSQPARGMTMQEVEARFGAPSLRRSAVGRPPITRWEYPGFVVYFEHRHVIHSVARRG